MGNCVFSELCQGIFHTGREFPVAASFNQMVAFKILETNGEHSLRDVRHC